MGGRKVRPIGFAVMKSLTEKLALPSKPLSEILGEMMAEAGPMIFQAMQR
jgi:hypothetical protein